MKVAIYSSHNFEKDHLLKANAGKHQLIFIQDVLSKETASLAQGCAAVAAFVSDDLCGEVLQELDRLGVRFICLRSAGYNHINLSVAKKLGLHTARVPAYSPNSVAEHAVALMMALNRKIVKANTATHRLDFSLDGLVGFDMKGKTVGIVGTGKIGAVLAAIMHGFGCTILACDKIKNPDLVSHYGVTYCDLQELCRNSDLISLHVPLSLETEFMIDKKMIAQMKRGVMLINTGRGKLLNVPDVIAALKTCQIGSFGMDVYSDESLFFKNHNGEILKDDLLARLMTFENVIITGHQAFLTQEALTNIATTTIFNLDCFENKKHCDNLIV
jgi:D-lactate dehydrogenase